MCDHENREAAMVTTHRNAEGVPSVWCDPCLVPLVKSLNDGGARTVASCCGHGRQPGRIALKDGRELFILPDFDSARDAFAVLADSSRLQCPNQYDVGGCSDDDVPLPAGWWGARRTT